jgi:AcrR family transcriptional regulator
MSTATRERLLDAAESLFAARGVAAVSLREINRDAGARNVGAVQYHFGDRAGVVTAIVERHMPAIEARRHALLDQYEATGDHDVRQLASVLVRPLAAELHAGQGGPAFLQILADLLGGPDPMVDLSQTPSMFRWRDALEPLLAPEAVRLHRRFATLRFTAEELGRRARATSRRSDALFVSQLIDLVTAMLLAPSSEETRRLLSEVGTDDEREPAAHRARSAPTRSRPERTTP